MVFSPDLFKDKAPVTMIRLNEIVSWRIPEETRSQLLKTYFVLFSSLVAFLPAPVALLTAPTGRSRSLPSIAASPSETWRFFYTRSSDACSSPSPTKLARGAMLRRCSRGSPASSQGTRTPGCCITATRRSRWDADSEGLNALLSRTLLHCGGAGQKPPWS